MNFQSSEIQLTLLIKECKEMKMQRNQITILQMSFPLYSDLSTNQPKKEENVMLLM